MDSPKKENVMDNKCSTQGCCETETQEGCQTTGGQDCGCPVEKATTQWQGTFCSALGEVQKDILKEKIRKAWGPKLDKAADAVLEAAEAEWNAMLSKGKAKMTLKEKMMSILTEGKK